MESKICSCFGHSQIEITNELKQKIKYIYQDLIVNKNFDTFLFGGFGQFDELCYQIISELKNKYNHIKRVYCLENKKYLNLFKLKYSQYYEDFIYLNLDFDFWYKRIYFRNCEMVNKSDFILFYVNKQQNSGAFKIFKYAKLKKKPLTNIA